MSAMLGVAGAGLAVGAEAVAEAASAQTAPGPPFQPARHPQDDWMDRLPGRHRVVFDTTNAGGIGAALLYANNFLNATKDGYGLGESESALVIVARHTSTSYAFNDRMWAKYGARLTALTGLMDPATRQPPTVNLYNTTSADLLSRGVTIDSLVAKGVHFAVCQMAARFISGQLAQATGAKADDVYGEVTANLVGNAHLAAAGIVAVNRAQERGYTLTTVA